MSEDIYAKPDLTKKVRYGQREREQEMEEEGEMEDMGEREEILNPIYESGDQGTQRDAVQKTTRQQLRDWFIKNGFRVAAVCLGLLCLLLIGLLIHNKSQYDNVTAHLKMRLCESCGFTFGGGVCYYISTEAKPWEESKKDCENKQSHLMIIKSPEKQDFVKNITGSREEESSVWLGLTVGDTVWKWVDGTNLTTPVYWIDGHPKKNLTKDCLEFVNKDGFNNTWKGTLCTAPKQWICERALQ